MNIVISLSKEDYEMLTKPNSRNERIEMMLNKQEQNDNKNKVKMTKTEYTILKNIDEQYQWIARDINVSLYVYKNKPFKDGNVWGCVEGFVRIEVFEHLFQFIKFKDKEPYNIQELLNNCEVCDD